MRLLMVGSEYAGTTTLNIEISKWIDRVIGGAVHGGLGFHDHFKLVEGGPPEPSKEEIEESLSWSAHHRQGYKHYVMTYHLAHAFFSDPHHLLIGMHFDDEVYGPRYFGYGEEQAASCAIDRSLRA